MTATEELRRMLDERGMEWDAWNDRMTTVSPATHYLEISDGTLAAVMVDITPEQAIEATLGRWTCRRVLYKPTNVLVCSECGAGMPKQLDKYCFLRYCPNCGRKVEE